MLVDDQFLEMAPAYFENFLVVTGTFFILYMGYGLYIIYIYNLVGGDWNMNFIFPIYLEQSSQLTNIFFRAVYHQPEKIVMG